MIDLFGVTLALEGRRWLAFPEPEAIAEADIQALKSVGLSRRKAETLQRLAVRIASRELTEEALTALSTSEALGALTDVPGIGSWTAAVILLRGLGRTDVFPPNGTGAARGLGALFARTDESVAAGREFVEAYVEFTHYVERLHRDAAVEAPAAHKH